MEKKNTNYKIFIICALMASILFMSIGYALHSSNLMINGTTTIGQNAKWDVHMANVTRSDEGIADELVYTPASIVDKDGTYLVYDIKLPVKGDFYEFSFDVVNDGTMDARISSLIQFGSEEYEDYLHYSLKYKDGNNVYGNDILKSGETRTMVLRVTNVYEGDANVEKVFNLSFAIQYVQK